MKKALRFSIIAVIILVFSIVAISCGKDAKDPMTDINTTGLTYVDGVYKTTVDIDVDSFNLSACISVDEKASIFFSKSNTFDSALDGRSISLNSGDNFVFAKVTDENDYEKIYKFNIYKKQIFTIEFETNGGTIIEPMSVKEGTTIAPPSTVKSGYSLKWDYDFSKPISSNATINAIWTPNKYKINIGDASFDVTFGESYDLTEQCPSKRGYMFNGWTMVYENDGQTITVPFDTNGEYKYANDVSLVPSFEKVEYSITYVVEIGGTNPNTFKKFTIEDEIELLDASWKDDEMVFAGWYTSSDFSEESKITSIKDIANNIEIWAKFDEVIFTTNVDFVIDDVVDSTKEFTYNRPYQLTAPVPEKGYVFKGWFVADGQEPISLEGVWPYKCEALELIAIFDARENDIEYQLPAGAQNHESNPTNYNVEMQAVALQNPTFGKHIFIGWYTDPEYTNEITELNVDNVIDEMTIYSKWRYVSDVTFDADGGVSEITSNRYYYGEEALLPTPTKEGNYFIGWYFNDIKFTSGVWKHMEDVSLTAKWIPTTYVVNYVLNGGIANEKNPESFEIFTGVIKLEDPISDGMIFEGWFTDSQFTNKISEIDTSVVRDITLYAKWSSCAVQYNSNGGSVTINSESIIWGGQYVLPTPEFIGYKFEGWYQDNKKVPQSGVWEIREELITLVAHWSVIRYTISYDTQDMVVDGLVNDYTVNSADIVLPVLSQPGKIFLGWKYNGVVSRNVTIAKGSAGDRSYIAEWCDDTDTKGFVYELREDYLVCVGFVRELDDTRNVYMPSEYFGYPVKGIASNAFSDFGDAFGKSDYKNASYYYTISIPQSITLIEANAFDGCNGICVSLYKDDKSLIDSTKSSDLAELLAWEKTVSYSSGAPNKQVRDCIWGFRPAIGWSRYSAVEIPDYYE